MKPSHILILTLPLLVPMSIAALVMGLGTGPTVPRVMEDFDAPDDDLREDALSWFADSRRTTLYESVIPYLHDEDNRVRDRAIRVLEKMKNPDSLPHMDEALQRAAAAERWDEVRELMGAMSNMTYPQSLPYFKSYRDNPEFPQDVKELAGKKYDGTRQALNAEVCFYTLGAPIYNKLGYVIYSQGVLFPEGRELVREARSSDGESAAP